MKALTITFICTIGLMLIGAPAFGPKSQIAWDDSAQAAAVTEALTPPGQAPGWSRGQQNLALTYDECVRRMSAALQAEGYRRDDQPGGNFAVGIKNPHTAVIICSPAPDARMMVQIVVASNGDGGGRERQCLQAQMERPGAYSGCGGNAGSGACRAPDFFNTTFEWIDSGAGSLGRINFYRDGSARQTWPSPPLPVAWRTDANGDLLIYTDGTHWVTRFTYDQKTCTFRGARDSASQTQDGVQTQLRPSR